MDLLNREARTAPCNSKRGIVSCFNGDTLDFAAMKRTPKLPSANFHRMYEQAPKASTEASENVHKTGCSIAFSGVRHLSKHRLFRNDSS